MNEHKCGGKPCDTGLQEEKEPCFIVPIVENENAELKAQIIQINGSCSNLKEENSGLKAEKIQIKNNFDSIQSINAMKLIKCNESLIILKNKVESLEEKVCTLLNCQNGCNCNDGDCQCNQETTPTNETTANASQSKGDSYLDWCD